MAAEAMRQLPAGSREWLRAQDLIAASLAHKSRGSDDDSAGVHFSVGPAAGAPGSIFGPPNSGFAQRP
jgi:hypothetical protein